MVIIYILITVIQPQLIIKINQPFTVEMVTLLFKHFQIKKSICNTYFHAEAPELGELNVCANSTPVFEGVQPLCNYSARLYNLCDRLSIILPAVRNSLW